MWWWRLSSYLQRQNDNHLMREKELWKKTWTRCRLHGGHRCPRRRQALSKIKIKYQTRPDLTCTRFFASFHVVRAYPPQGDKVRPKDHFVSEASHDPPTIRVTALSQGESDQMHQTHRIHPRTQVQHTQTQTLPCIACLAVLNSHLTTPDRITPDVF